jgi:4-amino-4-deoxy-L-arabinose transferase-like glycosyltransferase
MSAASELNHSSWKKTALLLLCISFVIRLACWCIAVEYNCPVVFDERSYVSCGQGYCDMLHDLALGHMPSADHWQQAFHHGKRPPVLPGLCGVVFFFLEDGRLGQAVSRLLVVIISALTTPLVYLLARKLTTHKAALIAGLIHMLYPGFIVYSFALLSETPYMFFLLASIYAALVLLEEQNRNKQVILAAICGALLALSGLCRMVVFLPSALVMLLWLFVSLRRKTGGIAACLVFAVAMSALVSPWLIAGAKMKDPKGRLGWTLYVGNHQWVPDGLGSDVLHPANYPGRQSLRDFSKKEFISIGDAGRVAVLREIKTNPSLFINHCWDRFTMLWSCEFHTLHCAWAAVFPPMPPCLLMLLLFVVLLSYIAFFALSAWGYLGTSEPMRCRLPLLFFVILGMTPAVFVVSAARYHLPLLALLLPIAGHGAACLKCKTTKPKAIIFALICIFFLLGLAVNMKHTFNIYVRPSNYYYAQVGSIDRAIGSKTTCIDEIRLRMRGEASNDTLTLRLASGAHRFFITKRDEYILDIAPGQPPSEVSVYAAAPIAELEITIHSGNSDRTIKLKPLSRASWQRWLPTGITGIEYTWAPGLKRIPPEL